MLIIPYHITIPIKELVSNFSMVYTLDKKKYKYKKT